MALVIIYEYFFLIQTDLEDGYLFSKNLNREVGKNCCKNWKKRRIYKDLKIKPRLEIGSLIAAYYLVFRCRRSGL